MASTIKLKNSTTAGNTPTSLETGEVAINVADGNLFYGSASAVLQNFVVDELQVKGNLTAQQYIVSSSVTYTTQSFSSGSTIFGDSTDDSHEFTGNITASGDISASGTLTANSLVGSHTLTTAAQPNVTSLGTLTSLTVDTLNLNGNTLSSTSDNDVNISLGANGIAFEANSGDSFILNSNLNNVDFHYSSENDTNIFYIDASEDKVGIGTATPGAKLDVAGNINTTSHITASGNISSSGDIFCNNITIADDITSVGDDIILKDNLAVSSSGGSIQFRGTAGGSNESITYLDSGGTGRFAMLFPGSDKVAITNRASNGTVEIRANSSTAGSGGEVTVAEFQDDLINLNVAQRRLLEVTSTTDGDGNGDFIKLGSTATTAGKIYYYNSSGNWVLTDADAASSSTGLIAVAMSNNSSKGMLLKGCITLATDPGTVGDVLYLQTDTAGNTGDATSTAPSGTGDVVRVIGYCLNSTNGQIYFDPSKDHIVHA